MAGDQNSYALAYEKIRFISSVALINRIFNKFIHSRTQTYERKRTKKQKDTHKMNAVFYLPFPPFFAFCCWFSSNQNHEFVKVCVFECSIWKLNCINIFVYFGQSVCSICISVYLNTISVSECVCVFLWVLVRTPQCSCSHHNLFPFIRLLHYICCRHCRTSIICLLLRCLWLGLLWAL